MAALFKYNLVLREHQPVLYYLLIVGHFFPLSRFHYTDLALLFLITSSRKLKQPL